MFRAFRTNWATFICHWEGGSKVKGTLEDETKRSFGSFPTFLLGGFLGAKSSLGRSHELHCSTGIPKKKNDIEISAYKKYISILLTSRSQKHIERKVLPFLVALVILPKR